MKFKKLTVSLIFASCVAGTLSQLANAQEKVADPSGAAATEQNGDALRKAAQNPVANLISVPVQNNNNFGIGPYDRVQDILNLQPVIPVKLSPNWNLITRTIQPIVWQPYTNQTTGGEFGLGDMNPSFFFSPSKPGKFIWGVGPALVLPTATNDILGQGKLSIGPTFVLLKQPKNWTLGVLTNNVWSVAGSGSRPDVNQFLLQYFINYNLKKGYYITWQPTMTADWMQDSPNRWVVPLGGGIGRIMKLGFQPVNLTMQFYGNAVHPPGSSPWGVRLQIAFLFPKFTKEQEKMLLEQKLKEMNEESGTPKK